jgi:hypothetical protein
MAYFFAMCGSCFAGEHNAATTTLPERFNAGLSFCPPPPDCAHPACRFQLGFERFSPVQHDVYVTDPEKRGLSSNAE